MFSGLRKTGVPTGFSCLVSGLCFWAAGAAQMGAGSDAITRIGAPPPRLGISEKVVYGVNLSDARAAMLVWTREIMKTIDMNVVVAQEVVKPSDQLLAAIRGGTVDLFCLTAQEYRQVAAYVDTSRIIADDFGGDELLLVVREGSGIVNLAGLRGRSVILQESPSTGLAEPWLTVSLWREGLESPAQSLSRMTRNTKLSQVVLPVFFGQADACVVTRRGLNTMFELNPQLSRKLKVLLASPRMVSAFFAWRKDYPTSLKKPLFDRLVELKSSPATRQILTLFQSSGFTARDADCLRPANSLLEAYERRRETQPGRK
jgi:ABC-type phosphate/phosphonate transport system substrate-binding protein